jgi:hypothetical protein
MIVSANKLRNENNLNLMEDKEETNQANTISNNKLRA